MKEQEVNSGIRIGTMILDHFIMTLGAMIFAIPAMISVFSKSFNPSHEQTNPDLFGNTSYIILVGLAVYFCKDSINGRSPAKRILNLQVVDNSTGTVASPLKCFIRNIFCILWPIEVIVALANPTRRIGDFVAGTRIVQFDPTTTQQKPNWGQIGASLIIAYCLMLLIMVPFDTITSGLNSEKVNYVETSFNAREGEETEQLFADSLGNYLTADVKVYDKIQDEELKYISIIFRLKENYIANEKAFEQLESQTIPLLLTKFPEKTFVGRVQYVYQSGGSTQVTTIPIDWRAGESRK